MIRVSVPKFVLLGQQRSKLTRNHEPRFVAVGRLGVGTDGFVRGHPGPIPLFTEDASPAAESLLELRDAGLGYAPHDTPPFRSWATCSSVSRRASSSSVSRTLRSTSRAFRRVL